MVGAALGTLDLPGAAGALFSTLDRLDGDDRAILEIELQYEDEAATIPDYVDVIRDVSGEKAYKNKQLAKYVPMEEI